MKERPILFSGPMVRAILEGRKTMTRRVVNPQPTGENIYSPLDGKWLSKKFDGLILPKICDLPIESPFGQPGDRLWVRETWQPCLGVDGRYVVYGADYNEKDFEHLKPWKPSIHQFRADSRINLEITEVRVERLQDISREDAIAEGCFADYVPVVDNRGNIVDYKCLSPRDLFEDLWDSINGKRQDCSWSDNPYVLVISFKRV